MKVKSESEVAQSGPTLSDPMDCSPPGSDFPGKRTGVGCHCLLQISLIHGSKKIEQTSDYNMKEADSQKQTSGYQCGGAATQS